MKNLTIVLTTARLAALSLIQLATSTPVFPLVSAQPDLFAMIMGTVSSQVPVTNAARIRRGRIVVSIVRQLVKN